MTGDHRRLPPQTRPADVTCTAASEANATTKRDSTLS
jgi:hypothetical protein